MSVEIEELRYELDSGSEHNYIIAKSNFFNKIHRDLNLKNAIPVGTIEFVQSYLSHVHGIDHMSPIEIPKELRLDKFLLRDYKIVKSSDVPKGVSKFVKDASVLKQPIFIGNTNDMPEGFLKYDVQCNFPGSVTLHEPGHLYQVSDVLNILSEYRVIVMDHKILGIQFYDGTPTVMPNEREIKKVQEMVLRYSQSRNCPAAYGLDVAIIRSENKELNNRDLALIEIGPFVSMSNYGCRGYFLPQLYQKGLQWYLKHNKPIEMSMTHD
jgi:hypothetical protein